MNFDKNKKFFYKNRLAFRLRFLGEGGFTQHFFLIRTKCGELFIRKYLRLGHKIKKYYFVLSIKQLKKGAGFTLMEVIVATGIFVILVLAILGIFTSVLKAQRNTVAQTRLEREAQLVMETIVKSIRSSRVDYDEYRNLYGPAATEPPPPDLDLILINSNDERIRYHHNSFDHPYALEVAFSGFVNSIPITSDTVEVTGVRFYVEPWESPFGTGDPPAIQPYVTIVLSMTSAVAGETAQVTLQQTVPQRAGAY